MLILSGITFFVFAKRFFAPAWAGFGAIVYVFLPFHYLINWYIGQTIGAMMALAILPVLALAFSQLLEERKGGPLFALSFAALALSHLPTTLIVAHLLAVLVLWVAFTQEKTWPKRFHLILRFAVWALLGIALSAFYWLPALALLDTVSSGMLFADYYDSTQWLYLDGKPENDPFRTQNLKPALILAIGMALGATYLLQRAKSSSTLFMWIIVPTVFTAFLMTIISYPLWKFWIINKVQFPDRALIVTDLSTALASIVIIRSLASTSSKAFAMRLKLIIVTSTSAVVFALIGPLYQSAKIIDNGRGTTSEFLSVAPPEYVPPAFLALTMDRYREHDTSNITNPERFSILFNEMQAGFETAEQSLQTDAPGATLTRHINDRVTLSVDLKEPRSVRVPIPSWEYWRARTIAGTALDLTEDAEQRILRVSLPAGRTDIEFYLVDTWPQWIGSTVSFLALSLLTIFYLLTVGTWRRRKAIQK